jgi:hypothetical protein
MKDKWSYSVAGEGSDQFTIAMNEARKRTDQTAGELEAKIHAQAGLPDYAPNKAQEDAKAKTIERIIRAKLNSSSAENIKARQKMRSEVRARGTDFLVSGKSNSTLK